MELSRAAKVWVSDRSHFSGVNVTKHVEELHVLRGGCIRVIGFTRTEDLTPASQPDEPVGHGDLLKRVDSGVLDG